MSSIKQSSYIKSPHAGEVYGRNMITAGETYKVPSEWAGRIVRFYAVDGDARILFSDNNALTITTDSTSDYNSGTFVLTANDQTAPVALKTWSFTDIYMAKDRDLYFRVVGVDDVGMWYAHIADYGRSVI